MRKATRYAAFLRNTVILIVYGISSILLPVEQDNERAAKTFWHSLKSAFPDYEFRPALLLAGDYEEAQQVSMLGFLMGNHIGQLAGSAAKPPAHAFEVWLKCNIA